MNEVIHIVSKEKDYWKKEEVEKDRMYEDRRLCLQYGTCPHRGQ